MDKYIAALAFIFTLIPFTIANLEVKRSSLRTNGKTGRGFATKSLRQQSCDLPVGYPSNCLPMANELLALLFQLYGEPHNISLSDISALWPLFCVPECLEPLAPYFACQNQILTAELLDNAVCGEHNGENCLVLLATGIVSSQIAISTECECPEDPQCAQILGDVTTYLGCCAASFFSNIESPSSIHITPEQFGSCDVLLSPMCQGLNPNANTGVFPSAYLGLTVIIAISAANIA